MTKMRKLVNAPGFGATAKAGIKHHVKEEGTEMFPKLKKKLTRDELSARGDDVATMKQRRTR